MDKQLAEDIERLKRTLERSGIEILTDMASVRDRMLLLLIQNTNVPEATEIIQRIQAIMGQFSVLYPQTTEYEAMSDEKRKAFNEQVGEIAELLKTRSQELRGRRRSAASVWGTSVVPGSSPYGG